MRRVFATVLMSLVLAGCATSGVPLPEEARLAPARERPGVVEGESYRRVDTGFFSGHERCAGWLYLPRHVSAPPVVILVQGFGGEQDMALPRFAEHFARHGIAALTFDFRTFGRSEGTPRYWADADRQVEDLEAAIAHVRAHPDVDGTRLALWGTSFGAAAVLTVAARDTGIDAVVAQVPFTDGTEEPQGAEDPERIWELVRISFADKMAEVFGGERLYVKAFGSKDELALITGPEAEAARDKLVPEGSLFSNFVTAGILLDLDEVQPADDADQIQAPALFVLAERDHYVPNQATEEMAKEMTDADVFHVSAGHFEVYDGPVFAEVMKKETTFLLEHLSP